MNPDSDLQLVPETLLKRRHDLDLLKAKRAASALAHQPRKRSVATRGQGDVVKIIKPETILMQSRARRKGAIRYNRVGKKGMQKRASDKKVTKTKVWDAERGEEVDEKDLPQKEEKEEDEEGSDDEGVEEEATNKLQRIPYGANSVGSAAVFAVLLRPPSRTAPRPVRKTLSSLRLRRVDEGVFLPYTNDVRKMLHLVEPYVLYGTVGAETVGDMVRRRGFCKDQEGKRLPLADNNVIERELGDLGLICVEDLVQVLSSGSLDGGEEETFAKVTKFLWPFRLTSRKSKFQKRTLGIKDGKLYGDQGEAMNGYIREML
jgi:large subunit ribosomal protein L7e